LARGDAIVRTFAMNATTIAEVHIDRGELAIDLEVGASDLRAFANILPDELIERMGENPAPLSERYPIFFREDLVIRADGGPPLVGRVVRFEGRDRVRRDDITGEPLPLGADAEAETVLFVRLEYALPGQPSALTLTPPGLNAAASASLGFVAYHRGVAVNDFRYMSAGMELHLDWDDPWYSTFDNRNLRRQFYAPFSGFLYAEPYEVRQEIVLRPLDLQRWVDLGLEGKEVITVAEQAEIKRRVVEFFETSAPVRINGAAAEKRLDRVHFIYRNLRTSGVIDPPRDLDIYNATIGVIFYFPTDGLADRVEMDWELFDDRVDTVPASATDEAGALPSVLRADDATLVWQNFLQNPTIPGLVDIGAPPWLPRGWAWALAVVGVAVLSIGGFLGRAGKPRGVAVTAVVGLGLVAIGGFQLFGGSALSDDRSGEIVRDLLRNVYSSFDFRDEDLIYDTLERTVTGDLLTDVYLETRRGLELENQGGARAKVKEVEIVAAAHTALGGEIGFRGEYTWNVYASVGHWGHVHQRTNQYVARFVVKAVDGTWRITELELLQEERL
jgi:hypothetical protein